MHPRWPGRYKVPPPTLMGSSALMQERSITPNESNKENKEGHGCDAMSNGKFRSHTER